MPLLIDGYNLLHAAGLARRRYGPGGLEKARRSLLAFLAGSLGAEASEATVVFDAASPPAGAAPQAEYQGITVLFAASHADADSLIEELIRSSSAPKQLTVVSGDHRVEQAARRRRARAITSEAFLEQLRRRPRHTPKSSVPQEPAEKQQGPEAAEAEFWTHEFDDLERLERELRGLSGSGFADFSDDELRRLEEEEDQSD